MHLFAGYISLFFTIISPALAFAHSEELVESCRILVEKSSGMSQQEAMVSSYCLHYIQGFYDGYATGSILSLDKANADESMQICFPEGISWVQLAAVYLKWADDHPEMWHHERWQTLRAAFAQAFSCNF